ncbi:tetratricopeptide repeat protein [Nannocystis punicea]|uniref:Tetratricopeptide repeat protein n=1 Tax=Nannocystis punicea TaxID=2995304 RepID=A0ABY7HJL1_9BACT|nr:tetratricopeptide repeat protein [Nannocystis poenicansa]WAS99521.1 tetratricopeptide repeat protein [Nannocystis poenicansa]
MYNLANILLAVGDYDEALRLHERALAIRVTRMGPEHPRTGASHAGVGLGHLARNELDEAERHTRRALAIAAAAMGDKSLDVYTISYQLGDVLAAQQRWRDAAAVYQLGLELAPALLEPDHPDLAYPLTGLGRCHLELGRPGDALELLERALAIRRSFKGMPAELADTLFALARANVAAGRTRPEALAMAEEAAALYGRSTRGINATNRDEVLRWMAATRSKAASAPTAM